ncbi:hypothetical protein ACIG3E_33250 [Streptomyces sp. NPDC053474]|uniref:hypothetical protein n=1 Tax=Streptomyces sp. NPDC053474 TaxID=3365704 RepID=UPI0037D72142
MTVPCQLTAPAAEFMGDLVQGGAEERAWRSGSISPSDISAVMDRSPYQPRADLLHRKATDGSRPPLRNPDQKGVGWVKQPELAAEFAARHPQYQVTTTGYWRNVERSWQRCRPHRVLIPAAHDQACGPAPIVATLTLRTTHETLDEKGWGPDGGTQIPLIRYDEHQWLLDALGLDYGHIVAYSRHDHETRMYRIDRDEEHIATLREAARVFLEEVAVAKGR